MPRLRVHAYSMSLDGYAAGPDQDEEHPLGRRGELLHDWIFTTRTGAAMIGAGADGNDGIDEDLVAEGFVRDRRHHHGAQHVRTRARRMG